MDSGHYWVRSDQIRTEEETRRDETTLPILLLLYFYVLIINRCSIDCAHCNIELRCARYVTLATGKEEEEVEEEETTRNM